MILVTGGTGGVGSELLRLLSQAGVTTRALVRNPKKAQELSGVTWMVGDLAKPDTLTPAFENASTLFLLTSYYEDMAELQHNAIAAALAADAGHVVKVSAFAASGHSRAPIGRWHYQVEKELKDSGLGWTMLRPHHFMQNLLAQAEYVRKDGVVYSASGDGKIPYIDARDVAAVAFVTLTEPGHLGKTYVLTGSEAISYRQAAEIIGAVINKPVRFVDESPDEARARRVREGLPPAVVESALAISAYQRAGGKTVTITSTVADLTGRPPRTVAEFVREHAAIFRGEDN
jgi:uncharacterized protein YbjT (DUF2867 family)